MPLDVPIPPMPQPREGMPGPFEALRLLRRNVLELFLRRSYRAELLSLRLLGHPLVLVNHPELVREVFVLKHETYGRKSRFMEGTLRPVIGRSLFVNHGEAWAERRPAVAAPLHAARTEGFHPLFVQAAEELAVRWTRAAGTTRDVALDLAAATARVVMLASFGAGVPEAAAEELAGDFAAYQEAAETLDLSGLLGLPEWLPTWPHRAARARARRMRALVARLIARAEPGGLVGALRAARRADGSALLAGEALVDEAAMLLLAGSETSANALAWALYLAYGHAPTLGRLRAEAAAVLGPRDAPAAGDLPALPFTRAVAAEALRLYPPVAILSRQALAPDRLRRVAVPRGATVACIPWLLHRHEGLWHRPHAFVPERFLPEAPKPPRFTYLPFGAGPRTCAGAAFGQAEMTVFLATLVRRFDLTVAPGHRVMPRLRLTLRPMGGMPMRIARAEA